MFTVTDDVLLSGLLVLGGWGTSIAVLRTKMNTISADMALVKAKVFNGLGESLTRIEEKVPADLKEDLALVHANQISMKETITSLPCNKGLVTCVKKE